MAQPRGALKTYREVAAFKVLLHCRELGIVLLANGTGVHAIPAASLRRLPGMLFLVRRYRDEIMRLLDDIVE